MRPRSSQRPSARAAARPPMKQVALTFDDGPHPNSLEILAEIERSQVPATFYLLGRNVVRYPDIARALARSPWVSIGNHSMSHPDLTAMSAEDIRHELDETSRVIHEVCGVVVSTMRPPMGRHNRQVRRVAGECGMSLTLFSVDSKDWQHGDCAESVATISAQACDGDIILMHDTIPSSAEAVGPVIDTLRRQGFSIVSVESLIDSQPPGKARAHANRLPVRTRRGLRRQTRRVKMVADRLGARLRPSAHA